MTLEIYGASDDLIEIVGDVDEEFNVYDIDSGIYLCLSNGVVLSVSYGEGGIWHFAEVENPAGIQIERKQPTGEEYSERVKFTDPIYWVAVSKEYKRSRWNRK